jgi:hypothetical protein
VQHSAWKNDSRFSEKCRTLFSSFGAFAGWRKISFSHFGPSHYKSNQLEGEDKSR